MLLLEYQNPYWKDNPKFFLELLDLVKTYYYNGSYVHRLKANGKKRHPNIIPPYKHLRLWIEKVTQQYDNQILDLTTRVYWVLKGLVEAPRCFNERCNKRIVHKTFDYTKQHNPIYCSLMCNNTSSMHIVKASRTRKKRAIEDKDQQKRIEAKKRATKVKNGHSPNWNNAEKRLQTCKQRVFEDPDYFNKIEQKRKSTKVKKGYSPNWHNEKQMVSTRYEKNGGVWESKDMVERKIAKSYEKYGFASPNQSPIVKQHKKEGCLKKFGVDSYSKTEAYHRQMMAVNDQRKEKEFATKKRNGSWNVSKPEDRVYGFLTSKFGKEDVERQYRSSSYPFSCNFYIKSLDLYIECNFSWTHGGHWFGSNNKDDIAIVQKWKSKHTKYYDNAIANWTIRDIKKRECLEKNKLNYIVMWKEDYDNLEEELVSFRGK